ncbi:MAG: hypothetical protein IPJ06_10770 [Saprospiraceae bacterium]|nr:hypothetical protein [Saprospiraceae bacterium]
MEWDSASLAKPGKGPAVRGRSTGCSACPDTIRNEYAYQPNILWNGQFGATHLNVGTETQWEYGTPKATNLLGYEGTETQAIAGLTVHRMDVNANWADLYKYRDLFHAAFPGIPDDQLFTKEYAGLAIAAYERTILANRAPFQDWLKGKRSVMMIKKERAIVFFKDANCTSCHTGLP